MVLKVIKVKLDQKVPLVIQVNKDETEKLVTLDHRDQKVTLVLSEKLERKENLDHVVKKVKEDYHLKEKEVHKVNLDQLGHLDHLVKITSLKQEKSQLDNLSKRET